MSRSPKKLGALLEERFGIDPEFVRNLAPVLERFESARPSDEEWNRVLSGIAAAYRARAPMDGDTAQELAVLLADFSTELEKISESMKVIHVYLERVQQHLEPSAPPPLIH
jgi:hypothetical protein